MKQTIQVGNVVDDGTGDYLRASSIKTRDNFNDIYSRLGDGISIHSAGAWKRWRFASMYLNGDTSWNESNRELYFDEDGNGQGPLLRPLLGESWTIDTTLGQIQIVLPPGVEEADYGKAIRIRDVKGTWNKFQVVVNPDPKDSIKRVAGSSSSELGKGAEFNNAFQDLELVFTPPRHWEYVAQKYVNGLTFGDVPSVLRRAVLARQDQRDFNFFLELGGGEYNREAVEIYRRGNLMYYGNVINDQSDFGSVPLHLVEDWIPNNPDTYYVGDLVVGSTIAGYDDRIWQCVEEHNSVGIWEDTKWEEFSDKPNYPTHQGSTLYTVSDVVLQEHDGFIEQFECLITHTSQPGYTDLTTDSNWRQITNGDLAPLDGKTIRLRIGANNLDPIAMVTYLSDVSSFRTSYEVHNIRLIDSNNHGVEPSPGQIVQREFVPGMKLTLTEFGLPEFKQYNPNTLEVLINGTILTRPNTAGYGDSGIGEYDYDAIQDDDGRWNTVKFYEPLSDSDIVTFRWFDNVIGTLLSWDEGDDNILARSREVFVSRDDWADVRRKNTMTYSDPQRPSYGNSEVDSNEESLAPGSNLNDLMRSIYPIGSIYINANNPNNPADYMGFGTWVRYGQGRVIAGWNGVDDGAFHRNNNENNEPVAGGTGGNIGVVLAKENIPELISSTNPNPDNDASRDLGNPTEQYALVARTYQAGGDINLNGCLGDPDAEIPLAYYSEEPIRVNHGQIAQAVNVTQPYITAYMWIRTA